MKKNRMQSSSLNTTDAELSRWEDDGGAIIGEIGRKIDLEPSPKERRVELMLVCAIVFIAHAAPFGGSLFGFGTGQARACTDIAQLFAKCCVALAFCNSIFNQRRRMKAAILRGATTASVESIMGVGALLVFLLITPFYLHSYLGDVVATAIAVSIAMLVAIVDRRFDSYHAFVEATPLITLTLVCTWVLFNQHHFHAHREEFISGASIGAGSIHSIRYLIACWCIGVKQLP